MNLKKKGKVRYISSDKIFDIVNLLGMLVLLVVFAWPLWFVVIASVSDPNEVWLGNVVLLWKNFTLVAYEEVIKYEAIWIGYKNTIIYTVLGTVLNVLMTICAAYPLSRKDWMPRKVVAYLILFTMYFSGGLIPTYLVVNNLHLTNTLWAMIIPGACSVSNILITRTYFISSIPESLKEAADLDGANALQYLIKVLLPLSKPIIAVITLYYAVGHWNNYFSALIYLSDVDLMPLQSFLRDLLMSSKMVMNTVDSGMDTVEYLRQMQLAQNLKYSAIIVSTIPVLCIYPRIQKYFVKGIMVGSVKG